MKKSKKTDKQTWPKIRKFFNDIHLWGGLISGIVVFIVCITGTIYVYNTEIRQLALSEYYKVRPLGDKLPVDDLISKVRSEIKGDVVGVRIPAAADASTFFMYTPPAKNEPRGGQRPAQGGGRGPRAKQIAVNPYTGEIIGDPSEVDSKTTEFMQKMFGLHRWLLLNEIEEPIFKDIENRKLGSWITGTATLLFLLGVLTGIVIWFPKKMRAWKNGLKIRWSANWKRVNHDLHNTLAFYSCIILFLMAVTGPFWSFEWYREGWQKTWGTYKSPDGPREEKPKLESTYKADGQPLSIDETILAVNGILPYKGDITVNFAKDSIGTVAVTKNRVGFFAPSAADRLTLDQYSGEALEKDVFRERPLRERISASVKALHIGDVYGPFTKLLYFIACLIATSLPVTGVMIWINKMKKPAKKK